MIVRDMTSYGRNDNPLSSGSGTFLPEIKAGGVVIPAGKSTSLPFVLTIGLFAATRLWHLTSSPLSFDEIFSVHAVHHDWGGMFSFLSQDMVHPPLFYVLLKIWFTIGGDSLLWLRLFPSLTAIVSVYPLLRLLREFGLGRLEKNMVLVLLAVNGFLVYYSQLLRMYSLLLLFSLCSIWIFVRVFKSQGRRDVQLGALFGINLLLVYTHYFGWILVIVEFVILVLRRRDLLRPVLVSLAAMIICFCPWVYAVAQVYAERGLFNNLGWISHPSVSQLARFYISLGEAPFNFRWNNTSGLLLYNLPILLCGLQVVWTSHHRDKSEFTMFSLLCLFSFLPTATVYLASVFLQQSIWLPRGLIFVAVPYLILVTVAVNRLRPRWLGTAAVGIVLGWSVLAGLKTLAQNTESVDVNTWVRQMVQAETSQADDIKLYTLDEHTPYIMWFYLNSQNQGRFHVVLVKTAIPQGINYWLTRRMFQTVTVDGLAALDGDHFWVAFDERQWEDDRRPQEIFLDAGFRVGAGFEGGPKGKKTYLFPVWRQS
jgi:uncharacterized membrane protein